MHVLCRSHSVASQRRVVTQWGWLGTDSVGRSGSWRRPINDFQRSLWCLYGEEEGGGEAGRVLGWKRQGSACGRDEEGNGGDFPESCRPRQVAMMGRGLHLRSRSSGSNGVSGKVVGDGGTDRANPAIYRHVVRP